MTGGNVKLLLTETGRGNNYSNCFEQLSPTFVSSSAGSFENTSNEVRGENNPEDNVECVIWPAR